MNGSKIFKDAMKCLDRGEAIEALQRADQLVSSESLYDRLSGYVCRGLIYEEGGIGFPADLDRSLHSFHQAAAMVPDSIGFGHLARVSMKQGGASGYANALRFLRDAENIRQTPELFLGFAEYYGSKPDPDLDRAKYYYRRAALQGRFAGFFGYSKVARRLGQRKRALFVDVMRIALGPLIALLIGSKAQGRL